MTLKTFLFVVLWVTYLTTATPRPILEVRPMHQFWTPTTTRVRVELTISTAERSGWLCVGYFKGPVEDESDPDVERYRKSCEAVDPRIPTKIVGYWITEPGSYTAFLDYYRTPQSARIYRLTRPFRIIAD